MKRRGTKGPKPPPPRLGRGEEGAEALREMLGEQLRHERSQQRLVRLAKRVILTNPPSADQHRLWMSGVVHKNGADLPAFENRTPLGPAALHPTRGDERSYPV